jgi:hypothetical protein
VLTLEKHSRYLPLLFHVADTDVLFTQMRPSTILCDWFLVMVRFKGAGTMLFQQATSPQDLELCTRL